MSQQNLPDNSEAIPQAPTPNTQRNVANPTPTIIPSNGYPTSTSWLELARSHYSSVLDGSVHLFTNMWDNFNTPENMGNTQMIEVGNPGAAEREEPEEHRRTEDDGWEIIDIHEVMEPGENDLPSYSELEGMDLPTYADLGTKRVQIGSNVIVLDKNLHVSTFKNAVNV